MSKIIRVNCYHCDLYIPLESKYTVLIGGKIRFMCCPGCQAVAETIINNGLSHYYKFREGPSLTGKANNSEVLKEISNFKHIETKLKINKTGFKQIHLIVEGITCAACTWLIEQILLKLPGVYKVSANLSTHKVMISWNPKIITLDTILKKLLLSGYKGYPYQTSKQEELNKHEYKSALKRLLVSGLGMMQVMMFAIALYSGEFEGISKEFHEYMKLVSMLVTTPVLFYAGQPFLANAYKSVKLKSAGMDVPVSIALLSAYFSSVLSTYTQSGNIYFDAVCMFVFFLSLGRFFEMRARHKAFDQMYHTLLLQPSIATISVKTHNFSYKEKNIPVDEIKAGDYILVKPGGTIPVDSILKNKEGLINESILTGEGLPKAKFPGDLLYAGVQNMKNPIMIKAIKVVKESMVSNIIKLLERAQDDKPPIVNLANKISSWFVFIILLVATIIASIWYVYDQQMAFPVTLSVLVVTCPCALSLATPVALMASISTLANQGLLITRGHVIEGLSQLSHLIFDKTGTLTTGHFQLLQTKLLSNLSEKDACKIAYNLESPIGHPIATAFENYNDQSYDHMQGDSVNNIASQGVEGVISGKRYRIGKPDFVAKLSYTYPIPLEPSNTSKWILLGSDTTILAWFQINDLLRSKVIETTKKLKTIGIELHLLTGDSSKTVLELSEKTSIDKIYYNSSIDDKLKHIQGLQNKGATVMMVGDGINDVPAFGGSQISLSMGSGTDLAKTSADAILLHDRLDIIPGAIQYAKKAQIIIQQNFAWAILYNIVALPLAALGYVAPYTAALGMSLSSLLVVLNSMRLYRSFKLL